MRTCRSATRSVSTSVAGTGRAHAGTLADVNEIIDAMLAQLSGLRSSGARPGCPNVSPASCCSVAGQVALKGWRELLLRSCYFERAGVRAPTHPPATVVVVPLAARVALAAPRRSSHRCPPACAWQGSRPVMLAWTMRWRRRPRRRHRSSRSGSACGTSCRSRISAAAFSPAAPPVALAAVTCSDGSFR